MLEAHNIAAGYGRHLVFQGVKMCLPKGEVLGLAGPSGQGKTTFGRVLAGLHPLRAGQVVVEGGFRAVQYLHQSPLSAMNPRWRVGRVLSEVAAPSPADCDAIGVSPTWFDRYPHEMSGGQLQRISILRALTARPAFLIADEITAALDPVAQVQIWTVLGRLAAQNRIGILAISHDEGLLARVCTIGQMRL